MTDRLLGTHAGVVDDLVVRRNDGAPAYNLAVVVDDTAQIAEPLARFEAFNLPTEATALA